MVELGPGQKPLVQTHYPHMLIEDTAVWTKFLNTDRHRLKEVWYDLRVGQAVFMPAGASDMERKIALGLTRKRIDVVCSVEGGLWVVEIKPYANMYALGQVLTYVRLFKQEYVTAGELTPVLVCDSYDMDLLDEFDEFGVLVLATL
ncbi:hypothetical protein ES705_45024 [subsurface metagenome]